MEQGIKTENANKDNVYPLLESIGKRMYGQFKDIYKDLAKDLDDVIQDNYVYYLDFTKKFQHKFKEDLLFFYIKKYVIWKNLEEIENYVRKNVMLVSLDTDMGREEENESIDEEVDNDRIDDIFFKAKEKGKEKIHYLSNPKELVKLLLKTHPDFNDKGFLKLLKERRFNIFTDIMSGMPEKEIEQKYNLTRQRINQIYHASLRKIRRKFLK